MAKRRGDGEGSITRRKDGRWQGSALIGYDRETGKPIRKYFYGKTRKEVQRKLSEIIPGMDSATGREKRSTVVDTAKLKKGRGVKNVS